MVLRPLSLPPLFIILICCALAVVVGAEGRQWNQRQNDSSEGDLGKSRYVRRLLHFEIGCEVVAPPGICQSQSSKPVCKPYRTPDYCTNSFPTLIAARKTQYESDPSSLESQGYWFHKLEDKLFGYVFATSQGVRAPQIYFCASNPMDLVTDFVPTTTGFVVRAVGLHSNNGIYVLPTGFGGLEVLRGTTFSAEAIAQDMQSLGVAKFLVEEYIAGANGAALPTEYKLHAFNGNIGSISVVENRGTPCGCWAEVDAHWQRLDKHGCFMPGVGGPFADAQGCVRKDFWTGRRYARSMKGLDLCDEVTAPSSCIREDVVRIATELSRIIGVYVRIDMFVNEATGEIVVQEFSFNHANGLRHCSARLEGGCVNSCFLGDMWVNSGGDSGMGGPVTPFPVALGAFEAAANKCAAVTALTPSLGSDSGCSNPAKMRFNKIPYLNGVPGSSTTLASPQRGPRKLIDADYPIIPDDALWLRRTGAISVFLSDDCGSECFVTPEELLTTLGITVTHPSTDPANPFWAELREVIEVQLLRKSGAAVEPLLKRVPRIWESFTIAQVAEAVHDEFPGSIHIELIKRLFGGALDKPYEPNCPSCAVVDRNIIPSQSLTEFIRGAVMLSDLNTLAFGIIGPINFSVKWHVGRARPEEVVWEIFQGRFDASNGVPLDIVALIKDNFGDMRKMQDFTAYPEGSPDHPSFPAMHSASSAGSLWLPLVLDLTPEQWCEVKAVDYAISYARTVAGVHYPTDNIAGLNIGQEILARKLPAYLAAKYGSDPVKVAQKIKSLRFDWNDYLTGECFNLVIIDDKAPPLPRSIYNHDQSGIDPLGMRFSKVPLVSAQMPPGGHLPMDASMCPISMLDASWLRQTGAISVFHPEDCMDCYMDPIHLLSASRVTVTHPNPNQNSPFWAELREVVEVQLLRRANGPVSSLPMKMPKIWTDLGFGIADVAAAVHDEFPGSIHIQLIIEIFQGALDKPYAPNCPTCATVDRKIIPSKSATEFIRGAVMLSDLNTYAFGLIGPMNFQVKWHVGRARPEEVVWAIYMDRLTATHGVPPALVTLIKNNFQLTKMQEFTAYPEGSPDHPSFPAMHSASSAASLWMAVVLDLTHDQWCEVKAVDYAISYARTVAGVHYPTDNIGGLNIGQEILAQKLPGHLAEKYGSDELLVKAKIEKVRFDWNGYLGGDCFD